MPLAEYLGLGWYSRFSVHEEISELIDRTQPADAPPPPRRRKKG